jgi:hypothetical protein
MVGRIRPRRGKPGRRISLEFDHLEILCMLSSSTGLHHPISPYIQASSVRPRVSQPVQAVDPHVAINNYMAALLGAEIQPIQQVVETQSTAQRSTLIQRVLSNNFVHTTLSDQDTFTLLNSPGMSSLIGFNSAQASQSAATSTVTYVVPQSAILSIGDPDSIVSVPPSGNLPGFIATVPTSGIRILSTGFVSVQIPQSEVPANSPPPSNLTELTGALANVFAETGPVIVSALQTGLPLKSPNAPASVPGLRLAHVALSNPYYPLTSTHFFLRMLRIAVNRGVFNLGSAQLAQVQAALQQFETTVTTLNQQGTFNPAVPPAPGRLPSGSLGGTLEISIGDLWNLVNVASGVTGLQLPGVGNFPGRIDVGYVFDRKGDYGLVLTLRGPLYSSPPAKPTDNIGASVQVQVSNAKNLSHLNGLATVEGLSIGTALLGTVSSTRTDSGVSLYATSAGYGTGLEYGTGISYTEVIPLGNVNALIPQAPPPG